MFESDKHFSLLFQSIGDAEKRFYSTHSRALGYLFWFIVVILFFSEKNIMNQLAFV